MSGGDYDPCECIFNHEMAMRRLLSLLRNNQGNCNDNECFQDGLPGSVSNDGTSMMTMMMLWMVMAFIMYLFRPSSMRPRSADRKEGGGPGGSGAGGLDGPGRRDDEPPAVM